MSRAMSDERKLKAGRGKGKGKYYRPWIYCRDLMSYGLRSKLVDWKHGRSLQLMSDGERSMYITLRWNDTVEDIREQYPLRLEDTLRIAKELKIRHPMKDGKPVIMTTDFYVTMTNGSYRAYAFKDDREAFDPEYCTEDNKKKKAKRTAEKLLIEKVYWETQGIKWTLVLKEHLDTNYVDNISRVVEYYNDPPHDRISCIKKMIAHKEIEVDMRGKLLDFAALADRYLGKEE